MRSSDEASVKMVVSLIIIVFLVIFYAWFYSVEVDGVGTVNGKWIETHTSCDEDSCTTSYTYFLQFDDGKIFRTFWGRRDWDQILEGDRISYHARGRHIEFLGWRIKVPAIFSFEKVRG